MNVKVVHVPDVEKQISGFANLMIKENADWWGTNRWIKHAVTWVFACNFFPFLVLFLWPVITQLAQDDSQLLTMNPVEAGIGFFATFATVAIGIGTAIIAQGALLDEKQQSTAEWVLSLPVTRKTFLLSKLFAYSLAGFVLMVLIPGVVAYLMFSIKLGSAYPVAAFLLAEGVVILNFFFYLALTFLLAAFSNSRGLVLGVALVSILGSQPLLRFFPGLVSYTPWGLGQFVNGLMVGLPFSQQFILPLAITSILTVVCIGVAIWKFDQLEF